jgi:ribose transport system permease protein
VTESTIAKKDDGAASRRQQLGVVITALGMLPVLILLGVGFELLSGKFLTVNNLSIVMQQASINIVLAAGMTFVILTGGIDLSVGSILAASAMVAASPRCGPTSA